MFRLAVTVVAVSLATVTVVGAAPVPRITFDDSAKRKGGAPVFRWEIVALPKGGKGNIQVLGGVTGTELRAQQERDSAQRKFPDFFIQYRKAK